MKHLHRNIRIHAAVWIFFLSVSAWAADVVIIANKNVPENVLTQEVARNIFLGKKTLWDNGTKIIPVTLSDEKIHLAFLKMVVKKTPSAFSAYWNQILFTGKGIPPRIFENEKKLVRYVTITRGAVGYVPVGTDISDVKVIKIIE